MTAPLGATPDGHGSTTFTVWAPSRARVAVRLGGEGDPRDVPLVRDDRGYHTAVVPDVPVSTRYRYVLDGELTRPDPASRWQPDGVHGPSAVVEPTFAWTDARFRAPAPEDLVVYELHVGTFTAGGTFDAAVPELPALRDLGVTAVELMPIAQFPGERNWGYDGVLPFAAQDSYGGPDGLRRFVDAAHRARLAVLLDVVHNHLGPEGNHLADFGPYFTDRYRTPWGAALNFDGAGSDEVRRFFIESALWWTVGCHVDGLRLDAVHAIVDPTERPFVEQLTAEVHERAAHEGGTCIVIAESAANDVRLLRNREMGGLGLDGVWSDDFHHALHVALTGERSGYYTDYADPAALATACAQAWVYDGRFSAFRGRTFGSDPTGVPADRFVVCSQNHDQVGNRAAGERLETLTGPGGPEVAAAAVLLSPFVPLLFMGEEYGDPAPFPYFTSHTDPDLVAAVRQGRADEFADLVGVAAPDPQDPATFRSAVLTRALATVEPHARRLAWYRALLDLRATHPALRDRDLCDLAAAVQDDAVVVTRGRPPTGLVIVLHTGAGDASITVPAGDWRIRLDSGTPDVAATGTARATAGVVAVHGLHAVVLERASAPAS